MAEFSAEPKRRLALDTDWRSAAGAVWVLRGTFRAGSPSWWTPLFAGGMIYCGITISDKLFKTAVFVFAIGPVSRMILWSLRASSETRWINEIFVRWIDTALCFGVCVYVVHWCVSKIRHV
jgi:hypothetical protein